jgi:hypothetical protein
LEPSGATRRFHYGCGQQALTQRHGIVRDAIGRPKFVRHHMVCITHKMITARRKQAAAPSIPAGGTETLDGGERGHGIMKFFVTRLTFQRFPQLRLVKLIWILVLVVEAFNEETGIWKNESEIRSLRKVAMTYGHLISEDGAHALPCSTCGRVG